MVAKLARGTLIAHAHAWVACSGPFALDAQCAFDARYDTSQMDTPLRVYVSTCRVVRSAISLSFYHTSRYDAPQVQLAACTNPVPDPMQICSPASSIPGQKGHQTSTDAEAVRVYRMLQDFITLAISLPVRSEEGLGR